jgi:Protein of unknown function (DUF3667).
MRKKELKTLPEHSEKPSKKRAIRNRELPIDTICRNCGSQLNSRYCHNCGQDMFAGRGRRLGIIIYNTFDTIFAVDNKIAVTLKYLLFYPGKLTNEYLSGHIVKYVLPAKLFWFISIIFFFFFSLQIDINKLENGVNEGNVVAKDSIPADSGVSLQKPILDMSVDMSQGDNKDTDAVGKDGVEKTEKSQVRNGIEGFSTKQFIETLIKYLPYAMLLATPLFAFLLYIGFRKRLRYYADHMIFSLHFHSFVFILFGVLMAIGKIVTLNATLLMYLYLLVPLIYFMLAAKNIYKPKIGALTRKSLFIAISYFFVLVIVLILLASLVIGMLYGTDIFTA